MLMRRTTFIFLMLFSAPNSYADSVFEIDGISMVPAIVVGDAVYIKPLEPPLDEKQFYLLGTDGKNYELQVDDPEIKEYEEVNWGFGESASISLVGPLLQLPKGDFVAFGKGAKDKLKWVPAKLRDEQESDAYSDRESNDYLSIDGGYGVTQRSTYESASIPGILFYANYRKLTKEKCDPKINKETLGIIYSSGMSKSLVDSYVGCDGESGYAFPLGPVLGILEITTQSQRKIWIVMAGSGYETTGLTLVPYDPVAGADTKNYVFIVTGAL